MSARDEFAHLRQDVQSAGRSGQWTRDTAKSWYKQQPFLKGSNYVPANAINQLEMWQPETFDPRRIDTELSWAESLRMNTMRVFLHDLLWHQDSAGFKRRVNTFLSICDRHKIKPMLVLFDSCWNPHPKLGKQSDPTPGVHNSGWVQGPGVDSLADPTQHQRLKAYVEGVVGAFGKDSRVLAWDMWNEPDNMNPASFGRHEMVTVIEKLLPQVFAWARSMQPKQPLTSGVWTGDWSCPERLDPIHKIQLESSDVISFHNYDPPAEFEKRIGWLAEYQRPLLCTEYMARGRNNTFENLGDHLKTGHQ